MAGSIAAKYLTPEAAAAVARLLEPGESLADASLWADRQRETPHSGPWHYVNVPITEKAYNAAFCPPQGCVVGKIREFESILLDKRASSGEKQVALRFLIHFIEDVHQPLHVGDHGDRGGNDLQVRFFGEGANLHQVWDSRILEHRSTNEARITREVDRMAAGLRAQPAGNEVDWANESLAVARHAYLVPGTIRWITPGTQLAKDYFDRWLSTVEDRLARAGLRVAAILNETYRN